LTLAIPIVLLLEQPGRVAARLRQSQIQERARAALETPEPGDQTER